MGQYHASSAVAGWKGPTNSTLPVPTALNLRKDGEIDDQEAPRGVPCCRGVKHSKAISNLNVSWNSDGLSNKRTPLTTIEAMVSVLEMIQARGGENQEERKFLKLGEQVKGNNGSLATYTMYMCRILSIKGANELRELEGSKVFGRPSNWRTLGLTSTSWKSQGGLGLQTRRLRDCEPEGGPAPTELDGKAASKAWWPLRKVVTTSLIQHSTHLACTSI